MNKISLKDFLEKVKYELSDDYNFFFEGQGDGTVHPIIEEKIIKPIKMPVIKLESPELKKIKEAIRRLRRLR